MNTVTAIAAKQGRDYITPEDVSDALQDHALDQVRLDALEVLGKQTEFGAEDRSLCAFVAFHGKGDFG
jgi:hypothetical protein